MRKVLRLFITTLFVIYLALIVLLYFFQRDLLYIPSDKHQHPFEEMNFENQGIMFSVIVLNPGKDNAFIYFGGNGEAVVFNAERFISSFPELTVYLVNYRGYGGSEGKPSETALYSDSLLAYDMVEVNHDTVSVVGRSLGSGVASYLSANRPIGKTVLITPYDSVLNVAKSKFSFFPIEWLLKDNYDSFSRAKKIKSKVLIIAGENDQVIPVGHSENLAKEFSDDQLQYKVMKNVGHNNLSHKDEYYDYIREFLYPINKLEN